MPNYQKKPSKKITVLQKGKGLTQDASKAINYVKRQHERKASEKEASERFSEYSQQSKKKERLRDADAPKTLQEKSSDAAKKVALFVKRHKKPRDERSVRRINPKILLWILGFVCLVLIILTGTNPRFREPFKSAASVFVVPVQKGINAIGLWLSDTFEAHRTIEELEQENKELRDQVDALTMEVTLFSEKEQELEKLQELFQVKDQYADYDMVAAHIISKDSSKWFATFTIDKGTDDGITKDMNVVASGGLVGIVVDAGRNYAKVRSIIDDESSVSAQFDKTSDLCIVQGSIPLMERNIVEFTDVGADVMISLNSAVVTSHVSSKYLPGILIGYISELGNDSNNLTKSGRIIPVVDFRHIQDVLVIKELKQFVASSGSSNAAAMINDVAQPAEDELDLPDENAGAEDAG